MAPRKKPKATRRRQSGRSAVHARPTATRTRSTGAATTVTTPWRQRTAECLFGAQRARATTGERWAYLWPLLLAAFLARACIALWGDFVLHPDEIMQYLEPAHYAAFGNGVLYWEYLHGARSWLIPGAIAGVLKALHGLGLGQQAVYITAVKLLLCLLSLSVPWAMYRFTQVMADERAARLALVFGCFWYELAALAHKPFTEFVGTSIFMVALALSVGKEATEQREGRTLFVVGLLAALTGAVRLQYAPVALLLLLLRSVSLRGGGLLCLWAGALVTTVLVGVLEWRTWGAPFHSYLINFFINLSIDTGRSGESSRWLLIGQLAAASGGVALLAFAAAVPKGRQQLLLLLISAMTLLLHLLPEHREYRFIHLLIPCWLMLLAAWITRLGGDHTAAARVRRWSAVAVLAFGIPALLNALPWQGLVYKSFSQEKPAYYLRNQDPMFKAMSFLAAQDDVHGVLYRTRQHNAYFSTGGYYYLHHDVPFYTLHTWAALKKQRPLMREDALVSHIVTETSEQPVPGFERLLTVPGFARQPGVPDFERQPSRSALAVWRRTDNTSAVPRWDTHRLRLTNATLNALVGKITRRLRASPLLGLWVADGWYWEQVPPVFELADEAPQAP